MSKKEQVADLEQQVTEQAETTTDVDVANLKQQAVKQTKTTTDVGAANLEQQAAEQAEVTTDVTEGQDNAQKGLVEELQSALTEANAKVEEHWNTILRLKAEMDNLRKRTERDIQNAHKYALERFVESLLPVVDSLELGIQAANQEGATVKSICEGSEMTLKMLLQSMEKQGVQVVNPLGERFNPDYHQAMAMQPHDGEANIVINVMQKGYLLNDRLVRPALVVVSKPTEESKEEKED
ncbi:MAG TPA: nucleotide exchange factor GrpE [Halothiobacillus sp.]|nr:nucleotide exchange factor GrpE [Halothiobacillus sp.]